MKTAFQILLLIMFVILSGIVLLPSLRVIGNPASQVNLSSPPKAPLLPTETNEGSIEAYAQQVEAYSNSVSSYVELLQASAIPRWHPTYILVVKDTLLEIFEKLVLGFVAYAFAKVSAGVVNNIMLVRNGKDPQEISAF